MFKLFKRAPKAIDEPNPWLDIVHDHDWLEANHGVELVCGMCGLRKPNEEDNNAKKKED